MQILAGTGTSEQLPTPTYSGYSAGADPGRYKYRVNIANYTALNTYTVTTSAGSVSRSGDAITVSGLSDSQSATITVTASRAGFNSSSSSATYSAPGAPCAVGTYLYGPVYYPSAGGVAGACGYNGVCNGNYGIGLQLVSGPCGYPGDYCAGCPV